MLRRAADEARGRGAPETAVAYLRRALEEASDPELVLELGLAESLISDPAAIGHLREAYDALPDPAPAASALAQGLIFTDPDAAPAFIEEALAAGIPLQAMALMAIYFGAPDPERIRARHQDRDGPAPVAAMTAYDLAMSDGTAAECAALAARALADPELLREDNGFLIVGAGAVLMLADAPEAPAVWEAVAAEGHREGSLWAIATSLTWGGCNQLYRGDLREAESQQRQAHEAFGLWAHVLSGTRYAATYLAMTLVERGDVTGARAALESVGHSGRRDDIGRLWLTARATMLLAAGEPEEALVITESLEREYAFADNPYWSPWRALRAEALQALGRDATDVVADNLERCRRWGSPGAVGRALRLAGEHEQAIAALEGSTARLELAKAYAAHGRELRRRNEPTAAREPLRAALELAEACGADGLLESVRSEIYATGARPRRTALSGADALTTSERRVADLAAAGQTNREIAQTLYVTPKTVEMHLGNSYRKLGIRSRGELAQAMTSA